MLWEATVGSEIMSHEGQLSTNMQVDEETSVNWSAPLGEGSTQGDVVVQNRSLPNQTDPLSRGHSANCSPTPGALKKSPNIMYRRGRSPTPSQKPLGEKIVEMTEKLKPNFHAATSYTQASLANATIIAKSGQSIAQAALQQTVEREKEIEHLDTTM